MNLEDLKKIKNDGRAPLRIKSKKISNGVLYINHKVAMPIDEVSSYFDFSADVSVFDISGNEIGTLCFTKELGPITWNILTENQFIAFLNEANYSNRNDSYQFAHNYLVIDETYYDVYSRDYKSTAALWGGFYHVSSAPLTNYKNGISRVDIKEVQLGTSIFSENAKRAVKQSFGHERYLKLYHLLELGFDAEIVEEIKQLDIDNHPEQIGKILTDYSKNDLNRLKHIINHKCYDLGALVQRVNDIRRYPDLAIDIFYNFGKETNPIKEEAKFTATLPFGFEEVHLTTNKINFQSNYSKFIKDLISYWIYRIRCCIAHNKIGEYILTSDKEEFIVEFAEPLLKEVLIQCFKK